jgi:hypothetical protein
MDVFVLTQIELSSPNDKETIGSQCEFPLKIRMQSAVRMFQIRTFPSFDPDTTRNLSNFKHSTSVVCLNALIGAFWFGAVDHMLTRLSEPPETM